jgi:hypothetical protein
MVKTTLIENNDNGLRLDLPCNYYSCIAIFDNGYEAHDKFNDLSNINKNVLAYIHVKIENKQSIKDFSGFIGDTNEDIKKDINILTYYPYTVKDVKKTVDKNENVIEYVGDDKDEQVIFTKITDMV